MLAFKFTKCYFIFLNINFDYRENPYNIWINSNTKDSDENIPIIKIPLNQYIIGNKNTKK